MSTVARDTGPKISISVLTIKSQEHSRPLKSVGFAINGEDRVLRWKTKEARTLEAKLEPPIGISPSCRLKFNLRRSYDVGPTSWLKKEEEIAIDAAQIFAASPDRMGQGQEWRHSVKGAELLIGFSLDTPSKEVPMASTSQSPQNPDPERFSDSFAKLVPTTDDIARICPRFRILLVGKTGVGKSSLINRAFGVQDALVSDSKPGQADINTEILSDENPRFVLHDSQGFEPGELSNFRRVREFIQTRNRMPELKDRLHAIWLCFATPIAGGRILETGVENLLKLKQEGSLGTVPIIIVLTKYDELVDREDRMLDESRCEGLNDEQVSQLVNDNAHAALRRDCISPLEKVIGTEILYTAVSIQERYQSTLSSLVQLTFNNVKDHVAKEASIVTAIAQKVNPKVKVDGSVEVGRSKYWSGLASSAIFPGRRLIECLKVIHTDIVAVWNFKDPNMNLRSKEFRAMMSNMVTDISSKSPTNPNIGLGVGLSVVATVAGIVSSLAGPAAPIVIPIAAGVVFAKWLYDVYQNSRQTLERIMAYIIDLTLVMQHIFCLVQGEHSTTRRLIKIAYKAYYESDLKPKAHIMIEEHVNTTNTIMPGARDTTIEKIIEIIGLFTMDPTELSNLQSRLGEFELSGTDEPW